MRGDSLRDLYAKTIAVCGLGLLAGAGALVDYWPTAAALPFVRPAFPQPALARALPVPKDALQDPSLVAVVESGVVRSAARRVPSVPSLPRVDVTPVDTMMFGQEVALAAPPALPLRATTAEATDGYEIALTAPVEPTMAMAMHPAPVSSGEDNANGFISSAFKKTGSSIASAGSKTGAAFVGAFRTMTGVMRRVNPFN
jgi:hypothetical protein